METVIYNKITLYKLSKLGKVLDFNLHILNGDKVQLITSKGYIDGAHQVDIKEFTEGKNIGRANETTPLQQAISELNSQVNKLLDKGYKRTQEELHTSRGTDALGNLKPMLAQKDIRKIKYPGFTQRKYDGVRCFSFVTTYTVEKYSRNGKLFEHLDHLDDDLAAIGEFLECSVIVDGELYSHDMSFQSIISSVKRAQPSNLKIGLRVYDIIPIQNTHLPQGDRMGLLRKLRKRLQLEHIEFVKTSLVKSETTLKEKFQKYISEGYEGLMWRDPKTPYEFGARSYGLIKYKVFDEEEFRITGVEEATGRDSGTAIFVLERTLPNRTTPIVFRARPMGTREERAEYFTNQQKYIGEMATIKFQGYSDDGVPRFPVLKTLRNYE